MNKWAKQGRVVGIVDDSDTQANGMLQAVCYLEDYDFPPEVVEYHMKLILHAEKMLDLIEQLHEDELCKPYGEILIERFLEEY